MSKRPYSPSAFRDAARQIAAVSRRIYAQGWSPATSSNYSQRLDDQHCAITVSGRDKGMLSEDDVMVVDLSGQPMTDGKPSAETGLHTQLYRQFPDAGAVLHTHSAANTLLTMHWPDLPALVLQGYELLKAFEGIHTHEATLNLPIFDNDQDIERLASRVQPLLADGRISHAYLIRGHGLYTWAADMPSCYRQLEALEFLLGVALERLKMRTPT